MKQFPVHPESRSQFASLPESFPWSLIEPYEARAQQYHRQSLERLAEAGGLTCGEIYAVVAGKRENELKEIPDVWFAAWLLDWVRQSAACDQPADRWEQEVFLLSAIQSMRKHGTFTAKGILTLCRLCFEEGAVHGHRSAVDESVKCGVCGDELPSPVVTITRCHRCATTPASEL